MLIEKLFGTVFGDLEHGPEANGDDLQTAIRFYLALMNAR